MPPLVALLKEVVITADPRKSLFVVRSGAGQDEKRKGVACSVKHKSGKVFLVTFRDVTNPDDAARNDGNELYADRFCSKYPKHKNRHRIPIQDIRNDDRFSFIPLTEQLHATFPLCESVIEPFTKPCHSLVVTNDKEPRRIDWDFDEKTGRHVTTDVNLKNSAILGSPVLWTDNQRDTTFVVGVIGSDNDAIFPIFLDKNSLEVPVLPKAVTLGDLPNEVVGDSSITLRWDRVEGAPNYRVYQMIDSQDAEWERIKFTTGNSCTLRVGQRGVSYLFKVTGENEHGEGKESNIRRVKVLDVPMPVKLSDLPSEINENKLTLRWSEPDNNGAPINHYTVYQRVLNEDGSVPADWTRLMQVEGQLECEVDGMETGKTYEYQVTATNKCGEGPKVPEIIHRVKVTEDEIPEDHVVVLFYRFLSWVESFFG